MSSKSVITLANWELVGSRAQRVRPHFAPAHLSGFVDLDGECIITSKVVAAEGRTVTTHSGSRYLLGSPLPAYVDWLAGLGLELDDENPLGARP
jgi:hypothetical protein